MTASPDCIRARERASLELDGELSDFEQALLYSHLAECRGCRAFRTDVAEFTAQLRAAELQPVERPVVVRTHRRRVRLALAPAAAAAAVAAVALGSIFTSSSLRESAGGAWESPLAVEFGPTNLVQRAGEQRRRALERLHAGNLPTPPGDLRGGPVR